MAHLLAKQIKVFISKGLTKLFWIAATEETCPNKIKFKTISFSGRTVVQRAESTGNNTNSWLKNKASHFEWLFFLESWWVNRCYGYYSVVYFRCQCQICSEEQMASMTSLCEKTTG